MHRDINQAAALLGLKPHHLRKKLREIGVLTQIGELHCKHRRGETSSCKPAAAGTHPSKPTRITP